MIKVSDNKAFTLIEVMVSIVIFGIIIAGIMNAKISRQDQTVTQQQAVEMQQTVRAVVYLMSQEIRSAGFNPSYKNYDTGITVAGANSITFDRIENNDGDDNDGDATIDEDDELETITYALNGTDIDVTFNAGAGGAPQTIAENIAALTFQYRDEDGNITANLDDIRSIEISVTAATGANELDRALLSGNNTRQLTAIVFPRNLGF